MQCIIKQSGKPSNQTRTGFTTNAGVEGTADLTKELLLFKNIFNLFLERGEGKEKKRERNINVRLPLVCPLLGDLTCNPGMRSDWESNW